MMKGKTVALVLSSGGARCLAQIGAIEELVARGYEIRVVAGSSGGAIVGGLFAAGKLDKYRDWIVTLGRSEVFSLMDISFSSTGFFKGERVFQEMEKVFGDAQIEDFPIPFTAIATDLNNKRPLYIRKGSVFKAIRASSSVPTVLTPIIDDDSNLLVDGGVVDPLPFQAVDGHGCDLLVAININASIPYQPVIVSAEEDAVTKSTEREYLKILSSLKERWTNYFFSASEESKPVADGKIVKPGMFSLMNRVVDLMQDRIIELTLTQHRPDVLVNVSRDVSGFLEFYKAKELIEAGRAACKTALDQYEKREIHDQEP